MSHSHVEQRCARMIGACTQPCPHTVSLPASAASSRLLTCHLVLCLLKGSCPGAPPGRWVAEQGPQGSKGACAQQDCLVEGMTLTGQPSARGSGAGSQEGVPCLRCCLQQQSMASLRIECARGLQVRQSLVGNDLTRDHQGVDLLLLVLLVPVIPHGIFPFATTKLRSQLEAGQHLDSPRHRGRKKKRQRVSQLLLKETGVPTHVNCSEHMTQAHAALNPNGQTLDLDSTAGFSVDERSLKAALCNSHPCSPSQWSLCCSCLQSSSQARTQQVTALTTQTSVLMHAPT